MLQSTVAELARAFIDDAHAAAAATVTSLLDCELAYVNVDHPDFIGMRGAWQEHVAGGGAAAKRPARAAGNGPSGSSSDREDAQSGGSEPAAQQQRRRPRSASAQALAAPAPRAHARHHVRSCCASSPCCLCSGISCACVSASTTRPPHASANGIQIQSLIRCVSSHVAPR